MNTVILSALMGVILMLGGVFFKSKSTPKYWAIAGIVLLLIVNFMEMQSGEPIVSINVNDMLRFNSVNLTFISIVLISTLFYFLLNASEIEKVGSNVSEYFSLLFFILCGVSIAASFSSLLMLFVGIEIITIPLYVLTGTDKRNLKSNEASLKYFLMGAFSTGIMLMGIAFLYGASATGSFYIDNLNIGSGKMSAMMAIGMVFILISMSFKVSAAPFHFWTPDVYDGAPTVFTSFMSTIVKAAGFIAFLRLFENAFGTVQSQWQTLVVLITAATLFIGNVTAVFQQSVKRMLAYSSIAQAGFMMFAIFSLNPFGKEGLILYTFAYSIATIGIFAILVKMTDYTVDGFNGLVKEQPVMAVTGGIFLLSLTGIPLTAGFQSKLFMLLAALQNGNHKWLVIFAVVCAAISVYYYFRVIQAMFFKDKNEDAPIQVSNVTPSFKFLLIIMALLIIVLGVYPTLLTDWLYY